MGERVLAIQGDVLVGLLKKYDDEPRIYSVISDPLPDDTRVTGYGMVSQHDEILATMFLESSAWEGDLLEPLTPPTIRYKHDADTDLAIALLRQLYERNQGDDFMYWGDSAEEAQQLQAEVEALLERFPVQKEEGA
jgi:hypothetical protein